jgi:hypothetical protein
VAQLGRNADGEVLVSGRVPGCYLGLRLDPPGHTEAAGVLVVAPAALLHPAVPQPDGTVLYELVTGHPDRTPRELVFLADLTVELRAWPHRHLDQGRRRPAGDRPRGHRRLAARRPTGPAAWRADRPGGPGAGAPGHDLRARPARRPAAAPARPRLAAVAAPDQRPPGRRPLPAAADTRRRRCPRWTPGHPDGIPAAAVPDAPADPAAVSSSGASGSTPCGGHSGLDSRPRRGLCCLRGHLMRRLASTAAAGGACMDVGRRRSPRPCPAQGRRGRVRGGERPSGQQPAALPDVQRTPRRCPARGRPGLRARSAQPADTGGPEVWTADAACGHPQLAGGRHGGTPARLRHGHADTAAAACWTAGSGTVHCRLHVRPGTGAQGAASASTAMARPPDP